jgi:hypothetical protein
VSCPPRQANLPIDLGHGRCSLCGRRIERRCKWCFKGELGDPPMPEMKAYKTWQNGLRRTLQRALEQAGISPIAIERTMAAVFLDRGEVPGETATYAAPYLARHCAPLRYDIGREWAILGYEIGQRLPQAKTPYEARFYDVLATLVAKVIEAARKRGITREQRSSGELVDLAWDALKKTNGIVDPDGMTPWHRVDRLALGLVCDLDAAHKTKLRFAPEVRVRVALDTNDIAAEVEAAAEEERANETRLLRVGARS